MDDRCTWCEDYALGLDPDPCPWDQQPRHEPPKARRSRWFDLAFVLLMFLMAWLVFGGGRWLLDLEVGL